VQIECFTPSIFATFCGAEQPVCPDPCKAATPIDPFDPFPIKPQGGPSCKFSCVEIKGTETIQVFTETPFPYSTGEEENAFSPCGIAAVLADQVEELGVNEFIGHGGPNGLCSHAASGISGAVDFKEFELRIELWRDQFTDDSYLEKD